jgi:hypothetical protein
MKTSTKIFTVAGTLVLTLAFGVVAATPEQEKAFTDKYKAAMEGKDTAALESFLYTQGSDPAALEFYKMMQSGGAGEKISKIELVSLTPEDVKKATTTMDGPTGKVCLNLKPTKKLVIKIEQKDASGSSSSSSENFVPRRTGNSSSQCPDRVSSAAGLGSASILLALVGMLPASRLRSS